MRKFVEARVFRLGMLVQDVRSAAPDTAPQTRDFTGKFGLTWEPSSDQTYYASFSRGIKGVGFNNGFSAFGTLAANVATLGPVRSEEHTSELQSLMRSSYAVFCLKKKKV